MNAIKLYRGAASTRTKILICCSGLAAVLPLHAQLTVGFQDGTTITPGSPSIVLTLDNTSASAVSIAGVNFFLTVGGGTSGPTISTADPAVAGQGIDLLTGTLFQNNNFGQGHISPPEQPLSQAWGVALQTGHEFSLLPNTPVKLATIYFDSFPSGVYSLDFTSPDVTSFVMPGGASFADVTLPNGATVTVVPEPSSTLACALILGLFGLWRWRRARA